jgi:pro-apoptotic serine protease NMA111
MERSNGTTNKRKASPISSVERPKKQMKPQLLSYPQEDAENTPTQTQYDPPSEKDYEDDLDGKLLPLATAAGDTAEWQATIEKVVRSAVSIHFCQTCAFDTDGAGSSEATGFVVDAEKGYILTNRHVVCSGPFWGYCIFDNHEEVYL